MLFTGLEPPQWMCLLEPPLLNQSERSARWSCNLETQVQFPVAAPVVEKLF